MGDALDDRSYRLTRDAGTGNTLYVDRTGVHAGDVLVVQRSGERMHVAQIDGAMLAVVRGVSGTLVSEARENDEVLSLGWARDPDELEDGPPAPDPTEEDRF
jgi:hypothetical protein